MEGKQQLQVSVSTLKPQFSGFTSPTHQFQPHHYHSSPNVMGSSLNSSKQVLNRLEVLPNQYGNHRLTPSTLVVKKVNAKMKGGLNLGQKKNSSASESSFAMEEDDPKKQSIPSFFPSTLRPRQGSAPSKSRKGGDDSSTVSGSYTSRKTIKSTPRQLVDDFLEEEIQKKSRNEQSGIFEKQLECLLMDDDIYAARQSIKDAYLFKSYERDSSKFLRKIELAQLGITLILHNKENFYNFYSRFKDSQSSLNYDEAASDITESRTEVDETSPPLENPELNEESNHLSIEPFITEDEKQEILTVLENSGEPFLSELFKMKYKKDLKSIYSSYEPQSSKKRR